ncbi:MAG: hypothetical protein M0Z73_09790 [Betaproteobacteria bacterium]|nr:hypothetical protein [Betaproteobacteria bacterium]
MQLLELTPAEIAFLAAPPAPRDGLQPRLTRKLAATLSARLRLPVRATARPASGHVDAPRAPVWRPDDALANLWLTRRLGGRRVTEAASFVPATFVRTLDAVLAECWLDAPAQGEVPRTLAWHITGGPVPAALALQLPPSSTDMTRWAREVIRHG